MAYMSLMFEDIVQSCKGKPLKHWRSRDRRAGLLPRGPHRGCRDDRSFKGKSYRPILAYFTGCFGGGAFFVPRLKHPLNGFGSG